MCLSHRSDGKFLVKSARILGIAWGSGEGLCVTASVFPSVNRHNGGIYFSRYGMSTRGSKDRAIMYVRHL